MIDYNFYGLFKAIGELGTLIRSRDNSNKSDTYCDMIQRELNKFFADSKITCSKVVYNINTDKRFFGIMVLPTISTATIRYIADYMDKDDYANIPRYCVEIDSRLFTDTTLSPAEIGALLLHDVNAITSPKAVMSVKDAMDAIVTFSDRPASSKHIPQDSYTIPEYIFTVTMKNLNSVFNKSYTELAAAEIPDFISGYNLISYYQQAITKMMSMCTVETDCEYPTLLLTWFLNNIDDIFNHRNRYFEGMLKKAIQYENSILLKERMVEVLNRLCRTVDVFRGQVLTESKKGLIYQMKRNGLRSLEDDLYEYGMRLRNVDTQDDAILLMRQINSRMGILEDYLREDDIDEKDRKRWEECYGKYLKLREELSKKTVYNKKMYGLFVDYNALQNMSQTGQLMNTYY